MSKGLEELEKLGNEYPSEGDTLWSQYSERFSIIEKELKDYEETKKELKQVMNDYQDLGNSCYKKLKAFEIAKKKRLNLDIFLRLNSFVSYSFYLGNHNVLWHRMTSEALTEEEFYLLKEVLL